MGFMAKLLMPLVVLGALGYFCIYRHAPLIEAAVDDGVRSALAGGTGLSDIDWSTSGRDVTVSGVVEDTAERARVLSAVAAVAGVRVVRDRLIAGSAPTPAPLSAPQPAPAPDPVAPTAPYRTRIELSADGVRVLGDVPDESARTTLRAALADREVIDETVLRSDAGPEWAVTMTAALSAINRLTSGSAELVDDRLRIRGDVATGALRQSIEETLAALDGVRLDVDLRVETPAIEQQQAAATDCQRRFDAALGKSRILFATGSAEIDTGSDALLAELATIALACPLARIEIGGHTDSTGDPAYNEYLSGLRATAVRDNLVARGVAASRLTATGYGAARPVADNATPAGRERNRRIEMRVSLSE